MTDKFDDGGPAYPTRIENLGPKEILGHAGDAVLPGTVSYYAGMSLHDAFAMAAMQGMLADRETILSFANKCREEMLSPDSAMATAAYSMADAMIAERNKRRGGMKKVSELTGAELDYWVAKAGEEWKNAHRLYPTMTLDPTFKGVRIIEYGGGR